MLERPDHQVAQSDIIVLATKPQSFGNVVDELAPFTHDMHTRKKKICVLSLMAGVSIATIKRSMPWTPSIVRAMPNICSASRMGTTIWHGTSLDERTIENITNFFESFGESIEVDNEDALSTATALSGVGPAYVSRMISTLIDAGVHQGLDREMSTNIVKSMVNGTARHLKISGEHPRLLMERVMSPGGVTTRALASLDKTGFDYCLQQAVFAASSHQPYVSSPGRRCGPVPGIKEPSLDQSVSPLVNGLRVVKM